VVNEKSGGVDGFPVGTGFDKAPRNDPEAYLSLGFFLTQRHKATKNKLAVSLEIDGLSSFLFGGATAS